MITIKRFKHTTSEYKAFADIRNTIWADMPRSVAELKHNDDTWHEGKLFGRVLAIQDGRHVAVGNYGEPGWSAQKGRYFIHIMVHPSHQNQGIGGMVFDHILEDLKPRNPRVIAAETREDLNHSISFLEKREFELKQRNAISKLDLEAFQPNGLEKSFDKVKASSIEIHTLAELQTTDSKWLEKMYDFDKEVAPDVPTTSPVQLPSIEQYEKDLFSGPNFVPEAHFVAVEGDQYVGYSGLHTRESDKDIIETGFSGVRRSHRRKGICTALKLCAIQFAKDYGAKSIITGNEENNPMYQLNLQLGYKPEPAWLNFEKQIQT